MIYADFESILVPENNVNQDLNKSYSNKYQKHVACNYGYKLVSVEDKFSKPFNSYIGEDAVYSFINIMFEEASIVVMLLKKTFDKKACDD